MREPHLQFCVEHFQNVGLAVIQARRPNVSRGAAGLALRVEMSPRRGDGPAVASSPFRTVREAHEAGDDHAFRALKLASSLNCNSRRIHVFRPDRGAASS